MTRVIFREEALADVLDAFAFYEERQPGLGERFRDHLDIAIAAIQRSPELYPVIYRDVRRRLVERFPYVVFYRLYPGNCRCRRCHARQAEPRELEATGAWQRPWLTGRCS